MDENAAAAWEQPVTLGAHAVGSGAVDTPQQQQLNGVSHLNRGADRMYNPATALDAGIQALKRPHNMDSVSPGAIAAKEGVLLPDVAVDENAAAAWEQSVTLGAHAVGSGAVDTPQQQQLNGVSHLNRGADRMYNPATALDAGIQELKRPHNMDSVSPGAIAAKEGVRYSQPAQVAGAYAPDPRTSQREQPVYSASQITRTSTPH